MQYRFGDFVLDTQHDALRRAGEAVRLDRQVFAVLVYLVQHHDRVVRRQELFEHLWPDRFVSDAALERCIALARRAVRDSGQRQQVIQTVHGRGYRFVAAVEECLDTPPDTGPLATAQPSCLSEASPLLSDVTAPPDVPAPPLPSSALPPLTALPSLLPQLPSGERRQVTVLCGTLAHATALADRLGIEVFQQLVQTFRTLAQDCVQRYEGTVQVLGEEGFLALFGVSVAQEEHAWHAVRAALELQQRLREAPAVRQFLPGEALTARVGVHTGWVIAGSRSDETQRSLVAGGDTTQGAMHLQALADPGTLVVSDTTRRLLRATVHSTAYGLVRLPGYADPCMAYTVQGIDPPGAIRIWSPFVGRQHELAVLDDLLDRALAGQGQVVGLIGEPGIGKSRLLAAFRQRLQERPITVLEGYCRSYDHLIPYGPVCGLLRHQCGLSATAPPHVVATQVAQLLQEVDLSPADSGPYLIQLLGGPATGEPLASLTPEVIKERTFATLRQVHLRSSQQQPLLLVVENLHWIDPTSEAYLAALVEQLAGVPLLLLTTYRPGYRPRWMEKSYATQLTLQRLTQEESQTIVCAVLPPAQHTAALVQRLLARAEGNPLFLEELAYAVRQQGSLAAADVVPETIQAVLAARIDCLPPEAKNLLHMAAVIGTEVPVPLLAALAELPEEALHGGLTHLQGAEFLYQTRLFAEHVYTFKHALTHEVAYGSLLQERRRALHAQIVGVLETLAGDRAAEQVDQLAHHALRGQVWDKAFQYCRQAGARAFFGSAYREAVGYWEQALEALPHLPEDRAMMEQAIDLYRDLATARIPFAQWEQRLTHLRAAESIAEGLADQRRLAHVYSQIAETLKQMQDLEPALAYCQRAHTLATGLGDVDRQTRANFRMSTIYIDLGDYRQAMACCQQTLTAVAGSPYDPFVRAVAQLSIQARLYMVMCLSQVGEFAAGVAYGDEARQIAEAGARPYERVSVDSRVGTLYMYQGALHRAIPLLERAVALSQDAHIPALYPSAAAALARAYAMADRGSDALAVLERVRGKVPYPHTTFACGEVYLRTGNVQEAHWLAQWLLADAREHTMRGWEAWARWLLGEIAMRGDPPNVAPAETLYHQALALAEALGMRPLVAHRHLGLGTLYATNGQQEQACVALTTTIDLYRAMEMAFWLPQAKAALVQVARKGGSRPR